MIYRVLRKLLHDSTPIEARVALRIFAENAPAKSTSAVDPLKGPCIIMRVISGDAEYHLGGECGTGHAIVQVDCYDESAHHAESLYELVRNRISGWYGDVADILAIDNTEVDVYAEITMTRAGMSADEPRDASDRWTYRWTADFDVFYEQSVPTLL